ncbi:hypothetical protein [Demequina zhanjiangensis]|uniref:Uncharacterized protein n=1 Tax=Demequina zhanjiangensis TaxID=3051659 RepID=A0ABT8G1M4_9MICO|nr:hypothetical protein [Demequina sp. SYSU T00b26]MDN4473039.1 hypothetical protein [Demequina sp. SYSU T00b26]
MPLIAPDPDVVEVRPQRRRHPGLVVLGTILVAAALVWGGFTAATDGEDVDLPTPDPQAATVLTPAQKTALAWNEWLAEQREAECLRDRGFFALPALEAYRAEVSEVAALLTVHAVEPATFARYLPREQGVALELVRSIEGGGCRVDRSLVNIDDAAVTEAAVQAARSDSAFRDYLAESLWVDANRAVVLAAYLDAVEPGGLTGGEWDGAVASTALRDAVSIAEDSTEWAPFASSEGVDYVQAWGEDPHGAAVLLRVEPAGSEHRSPILWGSPERPVVCGDVQVSLSMGNVLVNYDGPQRGTVFDIRRALDERWCEIGVEAHGGAPEAPGAGTGADGAAQQ